jgi:hypothetical protein
MFGDNIKEEILFYPDVEEDEDFLIKSIQEEHNTRLDDALDHIVEELNKDIF